MTWSARHLNRAVLALTVLGISLGLLARVSSGLPLASICWALTTLVALVPLTISALGALLGGRVGVDIIALLAMTGSLALEQYLAGAVIAVMLSGGQALEDFANGRARRELSALVERSPREVHRYEGETVVSADINMARPGDLLLVKPGEVVPVDGVVVGSTAVLDESALTGEAQPQERTEGEQVRSGTINAATSPFKLRTIATAKESTYSGIVRLVQAAQASKAPLVRLADRYALLFLPLTLTVAALSWLLSGDPVRGLAVLVVATPCPLILAVPVAIVSGISRSARRGIIVKGGGALETLARGEMLLLDKTGTVTGGAPILTQVESFGEHAPEELLRLAASLDQVSAHAIAKPIVRAAKEKNLELSFPSEVAEDLGSGISGRVDGRLVALGKGDWVKKRSADLPQAHRFRRQTLLEGSTSVFVAIERKPAGVLILDDPIRPDAPLTIRALRRAGFRKIILLTGDHVDLAETVGAALGVDQVLAERTPEEKMEAVRIACSEGVTVMVGDGINDAPALAEADIGVAIGARGASASSEAADIVLVVDRLDRLLEAFRIARRSRAIALQSIGIGMGLSAGGMLLAAGGLLLPVAGALLQEAIDVAVILNALRALRDGTTGRPDATAAEAVRRVRAEHAQLLPQIQRIRQLADRLEFLSPQDARREVEQIHGFLVGQLLPHEQAEDARVYPVVARLIGGDDPTATMSRAHLEIAHLVRLLGRVVEDLRLQGPNQDDLRDLRRILYGLDATLKLHFAQEEESYLALIDQRVESHRREKAGASSVH